MKAPKDALDLAHRFLPGFQRTIMNQIRKWLATLIYPRYKLLEVRYLRVMSDNNILRNRNARLRRQLKEALCTRMKPG